MPSNVKTIRVPHLGGIDAGYQMPYPYDSKKPTLVLVNSFMTSSELYRDQFQDENLTNVANLIAIELLGHGATRSKKENFTYWDTAIMNLQVLDELHVEGKIFVLGTSQGGWVATRMGLLAPKKVAGIIPLGSSMDFETEHSNIAASLTSVVEQLTSKEPTPHFELDTQFCNFLIDSGLGKDCAQETREHWVALTKANYQGDEGRRRARMSAINLGTRDGLRLRLFDVRCPVLWLHGTNDTVYSVANAREEIKMFVNSEEATLQVVEGGHHFLSFTHAAEVNKAVVSFIGSYV